MRLTCPACGATYDVPADAIPPAGREVECSECGAVWQARWPGSTGTEGFAVERALARVVRAEPSGAKPAPRADEDHLPEEIPAEPEDRPAPKSETPGPPVHRPDKPEQEDYLPETAETDDEEDEEEEAPPLAASTPLRRKLDDSILRILREEAEREARARAAERAPMETQPELGLPESPRPRPAAVPPTPSAPARATADVAATPIAAEAPRPIPDTAPPKPSAPKPRIEETDAAPPAAPSRFGIGFLLALALAAAALYCYAAAPGIATEFPALGPGLEAYVEAVDALRLWLAQTVAGLRAPGD